jgi:hypothetical protein
LLRHDHSSVAMDSTCEVSQMPSRVIMCERWIGRARWSGPPGPGPPPRGYYQQGRTQGTGYPRGTGGTRRSRGAVRSVASRTFPVPAPNPRDVTSAQASDPRRCCGWRIRRRCG